MALTQSLYPPSISGVSPTLTAPSASYRRSVWIVLSGLIVFMLFYLALCVLSVFAFFEAVTYPMDDFSRGSVLLKIGLICMSGMLCFFLVKGLFE